MEYTYKAHAVDNTTFAKTDIGDEYAGGIVIEGTSDNDENTLVLVTRHEVKLYETEEKQCL